LFLPITRPKSQGKSQNAHQWIALIMEHNFGLENIRPRPPEKSLKIIEAEKILTKTGVECCRKKLEFFF
jgi:hypothetical protein